MTKQQFWKGLFMAVIGTALSMYNAQPIIWSVAIITLVGTMLIYVGKNAIPAFQSTTGPNDFSWINALSGVLLAIGSGVMEAIATIAGTGKIDWAVLGKVVAGVTMTYIVATFFSGPNTTLNKQPDGTLKTQAEVQAAK